MLACSDVKVGKEQDSVLGVQGMSDLAAPLLCVMRDEAEAFWCFACLMEKLEVVPSILLYLPCDMWLLFQDGGDLAHGRILGNAGHVCGCPLSCVSALAQANFHTDCRGMQAQLVGLSSLIAILDPQLTSFLVNLLPRGYLSLCSPDHSLARASLSVVCF